MRVAVIFNRNSFSENNLQKCIGKDLSRMLNAHEIIGHEEYGLQYLSNPTITLKAPAHESHLPYKDSLRQAILDMLAYRPELMITVGGDGLAAYAAHALITKGGLERTYAGLPIVGIAAGTANVGPIVTVTPQMLPTLDLENLEFIPTNAVLVLDGNEPLGYGFNDVVIGNSFLTTIEGTTRNISVEEMVLHDQKTVIKPGEHIARPDFSVELNGKEVPLQGHLQGTAIKQIVVSSLQFDSLYGRAIMGSLVRGGYEKQVAALALCDQVIVNSNISKDTYDKFSTISHLTFSTKDSVTIHSLAEDAHVVIDGNPYIRKHSSLTFRLVVDVITIGRPSHKRSRAKEIHDGK